MPKNKPLPTSDPKSIEQAWIDGDELELHSAIVQKYARVLDMTDSGRDIKPLATGLFEAVDRYRALLESNNVDEDIPLNNILAEAERVLADATR